MTEQTEQNTEHYTDPKPDNSPDRLDVRPNKPNIRPNTWVDKAKIFIETDHRKGGMVHVHDMVAMVNGLLAEMNCRDAEEVDGD